MTAAMAYCRVSGLTLLAVDLSGSADMGPSLVNESAALRRPNKPEKAADRLLAAFDALTSCPETFKFPFHYTITFMNQHPPL